MIGIRGKICRIGGKGFGGGSRHVWDRLRCLAYGLGKGMLARSWPERWVSGGVDGSER